MTELVRAQDPVVARLGNAVTALAEAKTIQETKQILDVAAAAEVYAKRQKLGQEAIEYAHSIKIEALAKLGQMLKETPRATGGQPYQESTCRNDRQVETPTLSELGISRDTSSLAQKIAQLPTATFEQVKAGALAVTEAIREVHNHRAQGTGENEWYTPAEYVEAARTALGVITLDPATSLFAQGTVKAESYFTIGEDGLRQKWHGNVWLNPPYSQPAIQQFVEKLVDEVSCGNVKQAVMLTHNYTDTKWWHHAAEYATAICFTRGRISFESPSGEKAAPTQGQCFFFFGKNPKQFAETFARYGKVVFCDVR